MAFKNLRLGSDTSRLILLFVAILPATESKDRTPGNYGESFSYNC